MYNWQRNISIFIISIIVFSGCVSNKKATYLLKGDELKEEVVKNKSVRNYTLEGGVDYTIRRDDQLNIKVTSLTPSEYNVFAIANPAEAAGRYQQSFVIGGAQGTIYGYEVDPFGEIEMPMIGKLKVQGLTISELEADIQKRLSKYLKDPVIHIKVLNFRFSLLGEVNKEGIYSTFNHRITMLEAVSIAGGFTDLSDRTRVKLVRDNKGVVEIVYLDFLDEEFIGSPYYYLQPNDVLVVQPLKQRSTILYLSKNVALFTSVASLVIALANLLAR